METLEKTTMILNDLVEINNDRIVGYRKAKDELKEGNADLAALFDDMIAQSMRLKSALAAEIAASGEEVAEGTTNSGKIYRAWMDLKAVFSGDNRQTVLNNCEFGEDAAQKAYKMALKEDDLSANVQALLVNQQSDLKVSHDKIKALRDAQ